MTASNYPDLRLDLVPAIHPDHVTPTVVELAREAIGYRLRPGVHSEQHGPVRPFDGVAASVLADALEEAGCTYDRLLRWLRGDWRQDWYGSCNPAVLSLVFSSRAELQQAYELARLNRQRYVEREAKARDEAARKRAEEKAWLDATLELNRAEIERLEQEAAEAYAERRVSDGYAKRRLATLLRAPGIVRARYVSTIRGTPEPGEAWCQNATSGRWGKSAAVKTGRPLTLGELQNIAQQRKEGSDE